MFNQPAAISVVTPIQYTLSGELGFNRPFVRRHVRDRFNEAARYPRKKIHVSWLTR